MAIQNTFTLPPNTNFGATAFTNAASTQDIHVLVDGVVKAHFTGSGLADKNLGTQIVNSGRGKVQVTVTANGKASDLVSAQITLVNKLHFALLGSEDSTDADYNDAIVLLNWPLN